MSEEVRIERAADELRRLESEGNTLDHILNGEAGRRWIDESCGGDPRFSKEAFKGGFT